MITQSELKKHVHYDPVTGIFTRKISTNNRSSVGAICGGVPTYKGYLRFKISGQKYAAHRLAVLYMTGHWPTTEVDHINGNPADNRWSKLREVSAAVQQKNRKKPITNTSGTIGVWWNKKDQQWQAGIKVAKKSIYLGQFKNKQKAIAVRKAAEVFYDFHPNHGR